MKQITISTQAHEILKSWKIEDERFTDAILRIQERKKHRETNHSALNT